MNKSPRVVSPFTRFLSFSSLFLIASFLSVYDGFAQTSIKISLPLDRTVFQQNVSNNATFRLAGQVKYYLPDSANTTPEYKIERLDKMGGFNAIHQDWTASGVSYSATGFFSKTITTLPTGWYRIIVRYATNFTYSIKVGVGEVIFVAGQSNAQGVVVNNTDSDIPNLGDYDCLNAVNENGWCQKTYLFPEFRQMQFSNQNRVQKIAPNGNQNLWAYQALGKRIVDRSSTVVTPVMIFNAGASGTSIENWYTTAVDGNAITINTLTNNPNVSAQYPNAFVQNCQTGAFDWNSEGPEGHPYRGLRTALNYYGGITGTRGVIWHQGESDTKLNTVQSYYNNALEVVIDNSRSHFDANLGWAISRVSSLKNPDNGNIITSNAVKNAQQSVKTNKTPTRWGAYYSDEITDRFDGTHFNSNGLLKLAELYDTGNFTGNTAGGTQGGDILTLTPIESKNAPTISVTQSGSNATITLDGSYPSYRWVKNEGKINTATQTGQSITVANNSGSTDRWRCYALDNKGNVVISQEVALPIQQAIILGTDPCYGGTYTGRSDVISCNEISGWAFKASTNTNSGVGTVDIFVDGVKTGRIYAQYFKPIYFPPFEIPSYEGYFTIPAENASWKDGKNHTVAVGICETGIYFASATLNCPAPNTIPPCNCGFTLLSTAQNAGQYTGQYTFNSCNALSHKWQLLSGTTEITNNGANAYNVTSSTVPISIPSSVNSGSYTLKVDATNCTGSSSLPFNYTKPSGGGSSLSLGQSTWSPSSTASSQNITVSSNIGWSVASSDGSWLTASPTSGSNDGSFTISTTANGSTSSRSGTITVSGSGVSSQTVSVTQAGTGGGGTTDRTEGGTASDDGANNPSGEGEAEAFDNTTNTKWLVFNPTGNVAYDFAGEDAYAINSYTVASANDEPARDPKNWNLQGSNDNSNWTTVDTQNNQLFGNRFEVKTFNIGNTTAYKQYRLNVTANNGAGLLQIAEIQLFGPAGSGGVGGGSPICSPISSVNCGNASEGYTHILNITQAGNYKFKITYASGESNATGTITVDSDPAIQFQVGPSTGSWTPSVEVLVGSVQKYLGVGNHTVKITGVNNVSGSNFAHNKLCAVDAASNRIAAFEELEEPLTVYPNPTNGKIKLSFTLQNDENVWFNLYDTQGKNLQLRDFEGKKGQNEVEFDLQNHPSGAYFIDLQYNQKREVRKVVKVN